MEHLSVILEGAVLAGILWLFRSTHLILVRIARIEEHLRGQDQAIERLTAAQPSRVVSRR